MASSIDRVTTFLGARPLTTQIADLESALLSANASEVVARAQRAGIDEGLLAAAVIVRRELGRLSDLIHVAAILQLLPRLMEDGEVVVNRPSLAAGNDPMRPYDVETNFRVAEFKLAAWTGNDAMRKREVFKDLVRVAADRSGRRAELYVVGERPAAFLRQSRAKASWGLDRAPGMLTLFLEQFGDPDVAIGAFTAGPAAHVHIVDVAPLLNNIFDEA